MTRRILTALCTILISCGSWAQTSWFDDKDLTLTGVYYYPEHWDESQGALYFEKASDESTWHSRNLQKLFTHGAHTFYTEKE